MNSRYNWTELGEMKAAQGKYLFLLGGTYSPDRGCPEWGSNRDADTFYPGDEGGIMWNDPDIGIDWGDVSDVILSDKDKKHPKLKDLDLSFFDNI